MRHHLKINGLVLLDRGQSVTPVRLDHEELETPLELDGSIVDFLYRWHPRLKAVALNCIMDQHSMLFPYEDGTEARDRLETLLSNRCPVAVMDDNGQDDLWRFGDALRLELVLKAPAIQTVAHAPRSLAEVAVTEMLRNAYRRLHALERPLAEWFFNVFLQTSQPTQIPLDVLYRHAVEQVRPTPADAQKILRENTVFWKGELQSLSSQYLCATVADPKLMTLQNAAIYQQLKQFFGEAEV